MAAGHAAGDRPRRQRHRRREVDGRQRRHHPVRRPARAHRRSRPGPARHAVRGRAGGDGHVAAPGSSRARHALVAAGGSVVRPPGPLAGFDQRVTARRGQAIALVATARKLVCLFSCQLSRGEDDAFAQPSLTKTKMRRLELLAGAPRWQGGPGHLVYQPRHADGGTRARPAGPRAYERTVNDRQRLAGASATPGRASRGSSRKPRRAADHLRQADLTFSVRRCLSSAVGSDMAGRASGRATG